MVQTQRPLPLAPLRNALVSRMSQAMRGVPYVRQEDADRVRLPRQAAFLASQQLMPLLPTYITPAIRCKQSELGR